MTHVVALLGHPVAHSLSPRMHNAAFAVRGLDWTYVALDVEPDRLEEAVRATGAESLRYLGRTWKASPSEGYPTAHQVEQDRIVRTALGAS